MGIALLILSVSLQFTAAILAIRLIRLSGRAFAWILIAGAISLMGLRRCITLFRAFSPHSSVDPDVTAEAVALLISVLMVIGVASIGRIFAALRDSRQALEASRARYSTLVHGSPDGIVALDANDRVETFNHAAEEITGLAASTVFGRGVLDLDLFSPDDRERVASTLRRARAGERIPVSELEVRRAGDGDVTVELSVRRLPRDPGEPGTQLVLRDVDARKQLEQQLVQSQKLEALGLLAGGVAHDFNNLLTVIIAGAEVLRHGDSGSEREILADMQDAADRAAQLTEQLLAFGRRQHRRPRAVAVSRVVSNLEGLLRTLMGETVEIRLRLADAAESAVFADPTQLEQIVLNLAVNAKDAMPQGGTLSIGVRQCDEVPNLPSSEAPPHGWVELSIRDTGTGMEDEVLSRLFEPFFSTKGRGRGTGLGLATVHGIVEQSHGRVHVSSKIGEGSTFLVFLPAHDGPVETEVAPREAVEASGEGQGSGVVLLVEDDELVRSLARAVLQGQGYEVIESEDGQAALERARERGGRLDLLVSDMVMPGLSGLELAEQLRERDPRLPVIIMSGYTTDLEAIRASGAVFLPKPFTRTGLIDTVARQLRRREPPAD